MNVKPDQLRDIENPHSTNVFVRITACDIKEPEAAYIFYVSNKLTIYALASSRQITKRDLHGKLVDSGLVYTGGGNENTYRNYCDLTGTTLSIDLSEQRTRRFGRSKELLKGTTRIYFSIAHLLLSLKINIVSADIPIIPLSQDMNRLGIYFNYLTNHPIHPV